MEVLTIWVVVAIVAAIVASNKGRSGVGWFFLCILLTPLAILVLLALPRLSPPAPQPVRVIEEVEGPTKICPQCAENVRAAAKICRFCRHEFAVAEETAPRGLPALGSGFVVGAKVVHENRGEGEVITMNGDIVHAKFGNEICYFRRDRLKLL
jgi:uncharacterized protein (DUF58 family)